MNTQKNIGAFFDFDGTIYDGAIAFDFLRFAVRQRRLKLNEVAKLPKFLYYYALDKFKLADRYDVNVSIYKRIKGWNTNLVKNTSKKFFIRAKKKLFPEIMEIIRKHKEEGHKVVIVSSSLKDIIIPITKWIDIDNIIASEVETYGNVYTGVIKSLPVGKMRINYIREYCDMHSIEINKSYAYSDHYSDIPMLKGVGNPVAVNPERRLRKYAKEHMWRILDV